MKRSIKMIPALFFLYLVARFCHHETAGFRIAKIEGNTFAMRCDSKADPSIFDQKFHYFGRGLQSFSFLSEDGKLVLKIFNNRYQKRIFWLEHLPFFQKKVELAYQKLERNFTSYKIAYEELPKETGILYFHPSTTQEFSKKLHLVDKLGIEHLVDLDKTAFLIQRRATLFYPYLQQLIEENKIEEAKAALASYLSYLKLRASKGIGDHDPLIRANMGFYEGEPMQIDVGPFYKDESLKDPLVCKKHLESFTLALKHHLENHYPELASYLHEHL